MWHSLGTALLNSFTQHPLSQYSERLLVEPEPRTSGRTKSSVRYPCSMETKRVRAVLFDFDGTLGKYRSHLGLYVQAASEHGIDLTAEALAGALDAGWRRW